MNWAELTSLAARRIPNLDDLAEICVRNDKQTMNVEEDGV
jgi:hypothetical protein